MVVPTIQFRRSELGREKLVVRSIPERCSKPRAYSRLSGIPSSRYINTHTPCCHNALRAIIERVFLRNGERPPQVTPAAFKEALSGIDSRLRSVLPKATPLPLPDTPGLWTGRKRKIYENAFWQTASTGWSTRDAGIGCFPKSEKTDFSSKNDPAPRAIQPRSPAYNLRLARFLKLNEHRIYEAIAEAAYVKGTMWRGGRSPVVLKCYNPVERAEILHTKAMGFCNPVFLGLDASRFDQSVGRAALEWEHSLYEHMYAGQPTARSELRVLLSHQLFNKGRVRLRDGGRIDYAVEGCRMSGDMNTALGNCLIMSSLVSGLLERLGVSGDFINDGDDCVVILESRDLPKFENAVEEHFTSAGFSMKVEAPVSHLEQVEFCQCRPVWNGEHYIMVRDWRKAMNNDASGFGRWNQNDQIGYQLGAVGQCGGHMAVGIPILQSFYASMRAAGKYRRVYEAIAETGFGRMAATMQRSTGLSLDALVPLRDITPRSRYSFWLAFGVFPEQQELMEIHEFDFSYEEVEKEPTPRGPEGALATPVRSFRTTHPVLLLADNVYARY